MLVLPHSSLQSKRNSNTSSLYNNAVVQGSGNHVIESIRNIVCKQSITTAYGSIKEADEKSLAQPADSSITPKDSNSVGKLILKENDASYDVDKIEHVDINNSAFSNQDWRG